MQPSDIRPYIHSRHRLPGAGGYYRFQPAVDSLKRLPSPACLYFLLPPATCQRSSTHPSHLRAVCIVFNAEWINGRAAAYWDLFAGQPYFDERGVFMSALVSGPLIVLMIAVLVRLLLFSWPCPVELTYLRIADDCVLSRCFSCWHCCCRCLVCPGLQCWCGLVPVFYYLPYFYKVLSDGYDAALCTFVQD